MKKNKLITILLSLLNPKSLGKIKNKYVRYTVIALIGLAIAASTVLTSIEGEVGTIEPSKTVVEEVIETGVKDAAESAIEEILKNLF